MARILVALVLAAIATLGQALAVPGSDAGLVEVEGEGEGDLWAVLVAGSHLWLNYRHQADVCHAYQILHQHGVPDQRIIVMMYDDLAYNRDNPNPGMLINRPDGPNVYQGVPKDYTGKDVTPENFLKVLKGDEEGLKGVGSGKVLKTGPNDRVFINLVDHGAPGIFLFPSTALHVTDFVDTIVAMHRNKKFKEMTVYMEACESGSMFKGLPDDVNVYAVSAASPFQPSAACYYNWTISTFLGDVFSIKWMEDTDREDVMQETLEQQYTTVRRETTTSSVMQWGQTSISSNKIGEFLGSKQTEGSTYGPFPPSKDPCLSNTTSSPEVPKYILLSKIQSAENRTEAEFWTSQFNELLRNRSFVEAKMYQIVERVTGDQQTALGMMTDQHHQIHDQACHKHATMHFHNFCFNLGQNPYAARLLHAVVNLCEHGYSAGEFAAAARVVCTHEPVTGIV